MANSKHSERDTEQLHQIYYDAKDPGSYGGVDKLYRRARELGIQVNRQQVQEFLTDQQAYSLHKPVRKNFKRNKTFVNGIDHLWQADLADMQDLSRDNQGHRYILTVIDVFSKFAWTIPVKDKGSKSMLDAFKELFRVSERVPKKLQTDMGKEFLNKEVQNFLKSKRCRVLLYKQ